MQNTEIFKKIQVTGEFLKKFFVTIPETLIVLGTDLGSFEDKIEQAKSIDYVGIPNFPSLLMEQHPGKLIAGFVDGRYVVCMKGRFHYYEGYRLDEVTFPIRVMRYIGVKNLLITSEAGAIRSDFEPGSLMLIKDHINISGLIPLRGPNIDELGSRFMDCTDLYKQNLRIQVKEVAYKMDINISEGVYGFWPGPAFETPSEINMFRILGADAVGMSTVPEAIVAVHAGMNVVGISVFTNMAAGIDKEFLCHNKMRSVLNGTKDKLSSLLTAVIKDIDWNA